MQKKRNNKMVLALSIIVILFLALVLYLLYFDMVESKSDKNIQARIIRQYERNVKRGDILDRNGRVLVYSQKDSEGEMHRINNYDYIYSNIIGYASNKFNKSEIEALYDKELLNIPDNVIDEFESKYLTKRDGKNLYLTIDHDLQAYVYDAMGDVKGACIVMEPKTGNILAMVSKPSFNVNKLEENWSYIIEAEDSPLYNRAVNGFYPPGSIFKIVTGSALIDHGVDLNYFDTGKEVVNGADFYNFGHEEYGQMDLKHALEVSSNTYFVNKSQDLSLKQLADRTQDFMIGEKYSFYPNKTRGKNVFKENLSDEDKAAASFGQGALNVSPLEMANMINAIANNGVIMEAKIVDRLESDGRVENIPSRVLNKAISSSTANKLRSYLEFTANYNGYTISSVNLAGKTGSAENDKGNYHDWYVGFGPVENPSVSVTLIIEEQDLPAGTIAAPIYQRIMNFIFN